MDHREHVGLIRGGIAASGRPGTSDRPGGSAGPDRAAPGRWLELGAGEGPFTLALADLLGPGASILALDRDASALRRLADVVAQRFPDCVLETRRADFRDALPHGPFDGLLAANSLHFVADPVEVLVRARSVLWPGGRLIVVEYDADRGNPWVPHPFSSSRFLRIATEAGFLEPREVGRVPSRFLGAIYAATAVAGPATAEREPGNGPATVLHSRPHGDDREE